MSAITGPREDPITMLTMALEHCKNDFVAPWGPDSTLAKPFIVKMNQDLQHIIDIAKGTKEFESYNFGSFFNILHGCFNMVTYFQIQVCIFQLQLEVAKLKALKDDQVV